MANEEHLKILGQGVAAWNKWREENPGLRPDLRWANLAGGQLEQANFLGVGLRNANLVGAKLNGANLVAANLWLANLDGAHLSDARLDVAMLAQASFRETNFERASLDQANLERANLEGAILKRAYLRDASFVEATLKEAVLQEAIFIRSILDDAFLGEARLLETLFTDVNLSKAKDLDACGHLGPSVVDHQTIARSKDVPLSFWRGCGLPDALIDYMPSLTGEAIQFYSCFISYSSNDREFAERLYADLQNKGVRCWFAPHDLPIGEKILDVVDQAIRMRDKVFLILSESAISSDWVEDEVTAAFEEERRRKEIVLFPVRLDDAVIETNEPWARKLLSRNIGDFTKWKDHDVYKATFDRVLLDLKASRVEAV